MADPGFSGVADPGFSRYERGTLSGARDFTILTIDVYFRENP